MLDDRLVVRNTPLTQNPEGDTSCWPLSLEVKNQRGDVFVALWASAIPTSDPALQALS